MLRIVPYRVRLLSRLTFVFLALATTGLALSVLQQEKQLSYRNYQSGFKKTGDEIAATLRDPTGQLALLNPPADIPDEAPLHPVLLPFSALDFDDQQKVQQAVAMSGCLRQYGNNGTLCVAIGNNPWAGGFIYVVGSFDSSSLVAHQRGELTLDSAHRLTVSVALRGETYTWIAPFEQDGSDTSADGRRGRMTGFKQADIGSPRLRPVKDFRGWIWQNTHCNQTELDDTNSACLKNAFFSLRLPVGILQAELRKGKRPVWPPADLAHISVQVAVLPPGNDRPVLDTSRDKVHPAFTLNNLATRLLPGETLTISKLDGDRPRNLLTLTGAVEHEANSWNLLTGLIRRLPVDAYDVPLATTELIATPAGNYQVRLQGDVRSVSKSLSVVASRMAWFVGAMLLALLLAWLVIEIGIIRRIKRLTARADSVARSVKSSGGLTEFDVSDLRGEDELGLLASCLHDLMRRVREDVEREAIRAEQERNMWHAVGHEIMSPLQSLMALHGTADDQSHRYINRMQQAIKVLYGSASPSEAFQSTVLHVSEIDVSAFLENVATNAPYIDIADVRLIGAGHGILARADEYSLEDVVTHVLRNADRYREAGTRITMRLDVNETAVTISIHNQGPAIPVDMLDKIFEYGVSDQDDSGANGNRGQGLFVAKIYMAKMGGTIVVRNLHDGVSFLLSLQRGAIV